MNHRYKKLSMIKSSRNVILLTAVLSSTLLLSACSSSSDSDDSDTTMSQVVDPAPQFNDPGEFGCEGCPDTDLSIDTVTTDQTTQNFAGIVNDANSDGQWYIEAFNGDAIAGSIETDEQGNFTLVAPLFCGTQTVKLQWSNELGSYVVVNQVIRDQCSDSDIQLTLNWDDIGRDFELHLIKPGGFINDTTGLTDCTWTTCITSQPDWGVAGAESDNPIKDVDNTGALGPENIRLSQPESGTYSVFVEHWGSGSPEADANVVLNISGNSSIVATVENLQPQHVWYVGDISFPSQEVVLDGRVINCSANWSGGCLLNLPIEIPADRVLTQ